MKKFFSGKLVFIGVIILGIIGIPLTLIQLQQQQELRQHAWYTSQSASAICPIPGQGVVITVVFTNTEPANQPSLNMNVKATDQQTGKFVDMGSIVGGASKTSKIQTTNTTLQAGSVTFALTWSDGHAGTDTRTATYNKVDTCIAPSATPTVTPSISPSPSPTNTPTPTVTPSPTPTKTPTPTLTVTPTICQTLTPVKNVRIDCPNCQ